MADAVDDLEELLSVVHKTISDNKRFLERLVDETIEEETEEAEEETGKTGEGDFEEL